MLYYLYVGTGVKELRGWMMAEITGVFATHKILSAIPEWQVGELLDSEEILIAFGFFLTFLIHEPSAQLALY